MTAPRPRYDSVEHALRNTPRAQWSTSPTIYQHIQRSRRLEGITRTLMLRRGLNLDLYEDVASVAHALLMMKMMRELDEPNSFFYVAFRVVHFVVLTFAKQPVNTKFSPEISAYAEESAGDGDHDIFERLAPEFASEDLADEVIHQIDLETARKKLSQKLTEQGWPEGVKRTWVRVGRPPKQAPVKTKSP